MDDSKKDRPARTEIASSHGTLVIDAAGAILERSDGSDELDDIDRFDVEGYKRRFNLPSLPGSIDILFIGYWTKDGRYEPICEEAVADAEKEPDYRERLERLRGQPKLFAPDYTAKLAANATALAFTAFRDPRYEGFYQAHKNAAGGVTGIWEWLAKVAGYMTDVEAELEEREDPWLSADWHYTLDGVAGEFFEDPTRDEGDWKARIRRIIEDSSDDHDE